VKQSRHITNDALCVYIPVAEKILNRLLEKLWRNAGDFFGQNMYYQL
jgi:hypothetical protein